MLKRPGQLFLARLKLRPVGEGYHTVIEFADGTFIEVQGA